MIYNEIANVISNSQIADNIYKAVLYAPKISNQSRPGQFINILPHKSWSNVMRRPMSIASQGKNDISIIYKVFGEGTDLISRWKIDDKIDIIGPLGNYWSEFNETLPVLIGGGVGIAPIINLHNELLSNSIEHFLVMGARTKKEHFIKHDPKNKIYLSTDIEEYGIKGNVLEAVKHFIDKLDKKKIKIFSCGPPGMMKAVADYSLKENIKCDLALETIMACGIGICQGCTVTLNNNCNDNSYREKYALACLDGPIFNVKDIDNACFTH
ncbi:MAG: hypothetical protein CMD65_00275 [Gammaproteobacteria bacterium]|nr:hypothetical protein [Gammaproteobacteria bacterium]|tara:strand:- start:1112 stop:1915 length:804 start_codon:yes stop_codon:yes gene_type:complete